MQCGRKYGVFLSSDGLNSHGYCPLHSHIPQQQLAEYRKRCAMEQEEEFDKQSNAEGPEKGGPANSGASNP